MTSDSEQESYRILPDCEYWLEMQINPETVLKKLNSEREFKTIGKFKASDLSEFFEANIDGSTSHISKNDLVALIIRRHSDLKNTLLVLAQYSRHVSKKALQEYCMKKDLNGRSRTTVQLALLLFNNAPEVLREARVASMGYRIRTCYNFIIPNNLVIRRINEESATDELSELIENELSTAEKRVKLVEHHIDDTRETYRLFVKYENHEEKVVEWDSAFWVKPIDWIVIDYDTDSGFLDIRCRNGARARNMVLLLSRITTGHDDAFETQAVYDWSDSLEIHEVELESDKFEVLDHDIRRISVENAPLSNRPSFVIRGTKLKRALDELAENHDFNLLSGADIRSLDIKIKFEYDGVTDETTIRLNRDTERLVMTKETNEQAKRHLIAYIGKLLTG